MFTLISGLYCTIIIYQINLIFHFKLTLDYIQDYFHLPMTPNCCGVRFAASIPSGMGRPVLARLPEAVEPFPLAIKDPCLLYLSPYILL